MKLVVLALLTVVALLERTVFDLGPNVELVTALMVLSAFYFGRKYSLAAVLVVMVLSDLVIGNSGIFIFTWSGFLIPALFIHMAKRWDRLGLFSGIGANLFFFVWTNFGVWLMDGWGMYANDLGGLVSSYVNGLPFLRLQLMSTILFVPLGVLVFEVLKKSVGLLNSSRKYVYCRAHCFK